jgi:hypothetical protein
MILTWKVNTDQQIHPETLLQIYENVQHTKALLDMADSLGLSRLFTD